MKKLLFLALLFSACSASSDKQTSATLELKIEETHCTPPTGLNAFYDQKRQVIEVFWEASTSTTLHYMISLNGGAYQVVSFVNQTRVNYLGKNFTFENVALGAHTVCVRAVCLEEQVEGNSPLPSLEICTRFESVLTDEAQDSMRISDLASVVRE